MLPQGALEIAFWPKIAGRSLALARGNWSRAGEREQLGSVGVNVINSTLQDVREARRDVLLWQAFLKQLPLLQLTAEGFLAVTIREGLVIISHKFDCWKLGSVRFVSLEKGLNE